MHDINYIFHYICYHFCFTGHCWEWAIRSHESHLLQRSEGCRFMFWLVRPLQLWQTEVLDWRAAPTWRGDLKMTVQSGIRFIYANFIVAERIIIMWLCLCVFDDVLSCHLLGLVYMIDFLCCRRAGSTFVAQNTTWLNSTQNSEQFLKMPSKHWLMVLNFFFL